ncbi:MAG: ATP-binding protein [Chitinophagaceae bacterium]
MMNQHLQNISNIIQQQEKLSPEEKAVLFQSLKKADSDFTISEFKLDRTEKVKRTTAILLEETIEELELKRKAIEETNSALQKSLQELKATQAQLIQSEKMASLGELTAGIAHEIQNPLNFVNNFSEVSNELIDEMNEELDKGDIEEAKAIAADVKQNLLKINHHGNRAGEIVKGMLLHSRTSSGIKEPTDINALCDEYLRLAFHGLRAKDKSFNATLETDFDDKLEKINIISQDFGRVILNLLTNAFYSTNEKIKIAGSDYKPLVRVQTKRLVNKVEITISDNGTGIPKNIIDKIFQPFFTTKPTGQGTGLGLSLSYDIVKTHLGNIIVHTKEGEGTTFIIELPIA